MPHNFVEKGTKQQDKQFDIKLEHNLEAPQIKLSTRSTHYCITASLYFSTVAYFDPLHDGKFRLLST
jgi:hypothetical protein